MGVHLQSALDLSTAQLGLLISAAQLVPLVGLLVAGELLDRYSERWVVGTGAGVVALALGVGSMAPGYPALLVALLVVGAGYSTVQPAGASRWLPGSTRHSAVSRWVSGRRAAAGAALASAVLPLLAEAVRLAGDARDRRLSSRCSEPVSSWAVYRRPPAPPAPQDKEPSDPLAAQLRARLRMLREPSTVKIMLSGTSLISVQYGVGILTALHLHQASSVGAGRRP